MRKITKKWVEFAEKDVKVAEDLFEKKWWGYCVLFCHQAMEKILKAYIVEQGEIPGKTHDLGRLLKASKLEVDDKVLEFIESLSPHHMPSRYPDVAYKIKFIYSKRVALSFLKKTKETFKWVKNQLDSKK